ncbi:hypothetical protein KFE25_013640 [Diacronema lutheri]|uniref:Uncharacterized protein n=1 Tax=Diacronema lutheri TaxID=2081491 RepID=A0A8J5XUB7_DIALT|nr:hypothetical protein KFE25_013640 [Diacronema lutheri]
MLTQAMARMRYEGERDAFDACVGGRDECPRAVVASVAAWSAATQTPTSITSEAKDPAISVIFGGSERRWDQLSLLCPAQHAARRARPRERASAIGGSCPERYRASR